MEPEYENPIKRTGSKMNDVWYVAISATTELFVGRFILASLVIKFLDWKLNRNQPGSGKP